VRASKFGKGRDPYRERQFCGVFAKNRARLEKKKKKPEKERCERIRELGFFFFLAGRVFS
jgi:hypothetical protein